MGTLKSQTGSNALPTAADGKTTLKETNSKGLTLSGITEACPYPDKLIAYREALKTFMSSPMTSMHISALSEKTCAARNCSIRQDCMDVLANDADKSE